MSTALELHLKAVITVPEYFTRFVDKTINLNDTPKICCPFHGEDTPSFSYSVERKVWSCFGACKTGGDVINMHKKNRAFKTREEAVESLASILHIDRRSLGLVAPDYENGVNRQRAAYMSRMSIACSKANTVDEWLDLDYLMSFDKPYSEIIGDLDDYINRKLH